MMKFQNNKILIDGKELRFDMNIIEAVEHNDKLVIVFDNDDDEGFDNVYCYTIDKKLLWRIKPAPVNIGGTARSPYVGVDIIDGKCRAIDFFGRRFLVDIKNGEIISKDIVR